MEKILPTNDLLFKKTFTSTGHEHILLGFIQDILGENFKNVSTRETYDIRKIDINKLGRTEVDILAQNTEGELVTIEMQVSNHDYFIERTLYYLFRAYGKQYRQKEKGSPYGYLKKTYGINVLDFHLFEKNEPAVRHFVLKDQVSNRSLSSYDVRDVQATYFSLKNSNFKQPNIKHWQDFFRGKTLAEEAPQYIRDAELASEFQNLTKEEQDMAEKISEREINFLAEKQTVIRIERERAQKMLEEQEEKARKEQEKVRKEREEEREIAQKKLQAQEKRTREEQEKAEQEREKAEQERERAVHNLSQMGLSHTKIAEAMGLDEEAVQKILSKY